METILRIDNIEKYYGNKSSLTKAIDNISFEVEKGEFVSIMGASGSGKTTLLNCISTLDKVTSGRIFVGGYDITLPVHQVLHSPLPNQFLNYMKDNSSD